MEKNKQDVDLTNAPEGIPVDPENPEYMEGEDTGIAYGLVLFVTTDGTIGAQDMHEKGGALEPITDDQALELMHTASDRIQLGRVVRACMGQIQQMFRPTTPAPGALVSPDGRELRSERPSGSNPPNNAISITEAAKRDSD